MKIIFFFPYFEVSGVPVLFLNLAEHIADNHPEMKVEIVDFKAGHMAMNRKPGGRVTLRVFETGKPIEINDGVLVMQAILPYAIRPELKIGPQTKVLFWSLHPSNFFPVIFPFMFIREIVENKNRFYRFFLKLIWRRNLRLLREFVKKAISANSLHFMDYSNLKRTEEILGTNLHTNCYLPIASAGNEIGPVQLQKKRPEGINISWVGRLCDFKYRSVEFLMLMLNRLAFKIGKEITFYIIGTGPYQEFLQKSVLREGLLRVIFAGTIPKNELDLFLVNKINVNISMGTSSLDSARLHIPTILIDYSYQAISADYSFRWLHDTKNYDLGHLITPFDLVPGNKSLESMIAEYIENPDEQGELSWQYFNHNHSVCKVAKKLLAIISKKIASFDYYDQKYFKKGMLRRIYENRKYKNLSLPNAVIKINNRPR